MRPSMRADRVRYSAPFFYNPNYDAVVQPLVKQPHCISSDRGSSAEDAVEMVVPATTDRVETVIESSDSVKKNVAAVSYGAIRWGDYRNMRFKGDFKDVGEEVQIEHFQV